MRQAFYNAARFYKFEFWALTALFAVVLSIFVSHAFQNDSPPYPVISAYPEFVTTGTSFSFFRNYFWPQLARLSFTYFTLLSFAGLIVPGFADPRKFWNGLLLTSLTLALLVGVNYFTASKLFAYKYAMLTPAQANESIFVEVVSQTWDVVILCLLYLLVKWLGFYLMQVAGRLESRFSFFRKESVVAIFIWMVGLLVLRFSRADTDFIVLWMLVISSAIGMYLLSYHYLIPRALNQTSSQFTWYALRCAVLLLLLFIAVYLLSLLFTTDDDAGAAYSAFNAFFQLFVTVPLSWYLYKKLKTGEEKIWKLQSDLDRSNAGIDLLRSQINPHFLFNALNTLYGTALQENAERTSEGVQRLGDMMRFMLKENTQDFIPLSKETDYLKNYISLQELRTAGAKDISIDVEIEDAGRDLRIAPMLLIPFVENAFKHGISTRSASYIRIHLLIDDATLHFEVTNSKHMKQHHEDPEQYSNGIGLNNVKQRLQLVYPGRHNLIIRERSDSFTIHLVLQLTERSA